MLLLWELGMAVEDLRRGDPWRFVLRARLGPICAAAAASLANPFGWQLHAHALRLLGSHAVQVVYEFMPLPPLGPYGLMFLVALGIAVVGLAALREWPGWHVLLVFGAAVVAALASQRNAPLCALFALPVLARALRPTLELLPGWLAGRMRAEFARSDVHRKVAAPSALVALVALLVLDGRLLPRRILPAAFSSRVFPAAAVAEARTQGLTGRLLSEYTWGGYVLYAWPGQRVFIDSMADFFGDDLLGEYRLMREALGDWEALLAERDISLVLLPPEMPLVEELRRRPGWRLVHQDDVAVLLSREQPPPSREMP